MNALNQTSNCVNSSSDQDASPIQKLLGTCLLLEIARLIQRAIEAKEGQPLSRETIMRLMWEIEVRLVEVHATFRGADAGSDQEGAQ